MTPGPKLHHQKKKLNLRKRKFLMLRLSQLSWHKYLTLLSKSKIIYLYIFFSFCMHANWLIQKRSSLVGNWCHLHEQTCGFERYYGTANEAVRLWAHNKEKGSFAATRTHCQYATHYAPHDVSDSTASSPSSCSHSSSGSCKPRFFCAGASITSPCKEIISSTAEVPHGWNLLSMPCTWRTSIC